GTGGRGDDALFGARGNDRLKGGAGDDTVDGQIGCDRLDTGDGADVAVGEADVDTIASGAGADRIDAGQGRDRIDSGPGDDRVDGGVGGDTANTGDGNDLVLGGAGGDNVYGGAGSDRIYGELVDDLLQGGPQDDTIVGGHGVDDIYGESGDDLLRGDANTDYYWGGAGSDTVSYGTTTPPGPVPALDGAMIDLPNERALESPPQAILNQADPAEKLFELESVIGSNYDDEIFGAGVGSATGLGGSETCNGFLSDDCNIQVGATPSVSLATVGIDPGLLVTGGPGAQADNLKLSATATTYVVTAGTTITAGAGCQNVSAAVVSCAKPARPLGYATVWGGDGPDRISITNGYPETTAIVLDGGAGDDTLTGADTDEIMIGGPSGADKMLPGAGDDAMFSGPGADILEGGDGQDQLVTTSPCDGHVFSGGPGNGDIAGFAQTIEVGVEAQIGGTAIGRGVSPCAPTAVQADNEVLEGTQNGDVLIGNKKDNALILGKQGDDVLQGLGGSDVLRGDAGRDALYGGKGLDTIQAQDGIRDIALYCGPGGDDTQRDKFDPPGAGCVERKPQICPFDRGSGSKKSRGKKRRG
ncbi:MAG: calcium-binding protein, partial [Actinobacteria bacterium]|nr:calcium-binding protein [Actinomycetota bacterium]